MLYTYGVVDNKTNFKIAKEQILECLATKSD